MKWTTTTCQHKKNSLRWLVSLMSAVMKFAQGRTTGKTPSRLVASIVSKAEDMSPKLTFKPPTTEWPVAYK